MPTAAVTKDSTMEEILNAFPGAQRALFQRYHIGGCSSCGFQPTDSLEQVCRNHNLLDFDSVIAFIREADAMDRKIQITAGELAQGIRAGGSLKLLDVRSREEWEHTHLAEATHVTQELVQEILNDWAKDTPMVLYCHQGLRSMDAAAYFIGHGFTDVRSLKGGIDAWSQEVDSKIPRYQLASAPGRKAHLM